MIDATPSPASSQDDLVTLLRRAQNGSDEAARAVYERCREPLLTVIRRVIQRPLRRLYDSDDFLLSAFKEIFTRHFSDEVLRDPETLWPYLKRIAANKVQDAKRRHMIAQSRSLEHDLPIEQFADILETRDLSPLDVMILKELVEERLEDLIQQLPILLQNIVDLLLEGNTGVQIAVKLGIEVKHVHRAINWLKKKVME